MSDAIPKIGDDRNQSPRMFRIPLMVKCIAETNQHMREKYPSIDFGTIGKTYMVAAIVPNGCYYVLRDGHMGPLIGEVGAPNHLVTMERFIPIEWMTENGSVDK